jgi:hypothetical protein
MLSARPDRPLRLRDSGIQERSFVGVARSTCARLICRRELWR